MQEIWFLATNKDLNLLNEILNEYDIKDKVKVDVKEIWNIDMGDIKPVSVMVLDESIKDIVNTVLEEIFK